MPKFDHAVKFNGKYYPAGADIPEPAEVEVTEEAAQEPADAALEPADAALEPAEVEAEATTEEKAEAPKKAAKSRKKGDA